MFGRATITLGIGRHSSCLSYYYYNQKCVQEFVGDGSGRLMRRLAGLYMCAVDTGYPLNTLN